MWRRFHDPAEPDKVNEVREFIMLLAFEMQNKNLKTFEVGDGLDVLKKIISPDEKPEHIYKTSIVAIEETETKFISGLDIKKSQNPSTKSQINSKF